ncbi:MAG: SUMF1/EgtB/PvdO family nonheme iron enzyme [Chitinispirillia bacterium]|nr:SUMF1/EgtB/PvdO family nonheme iron enzyme [Chitinispirillia bacterium]MCL2267813.1 SUMF1/EgtB/PvdO family nonheme iron enzyme [Chitinispirillia bacterium]
MRTILLLLLLSAASIAAVGSVVDKSYGKETAAGIIPVIDTSSATRKSAVRAATTGKSAAKKAAVVDTSSAKKAVVVDTAAAKKVAVIDTSATKKAAAVDTSAVKKIVAADTAAKKVVDVDTSTVKKAAAVDTAVIDTSAAAKAAVVDTAAVDTSAAAKAAVVDSVAVVDTVAAPAPVKRVQAPPPPPKIYPIVKPAIDMVFIQGGKIRRGCPNLDGAGCLIDERPRHEIKLKHFLISRTPVTQLQWASVMGINPSHFHGNDSLPVEQVSWNEVHEFIRRLNAMTGKKYRLPTEAEWEYAALGGAKASGQPFFGQRFLADVAWYEYNSGGRTMPVGGREPNELGLYDMIGNVWEWVNDWYDRDYYSTGQINNPRGPRGGTDRVYRGCAFNSGEQHCRISMRNFAKPDYRTVNLGFRLAHSP